MTVNWDSIGSFDRYERLKLENGQSVDVTFENDGSFVSKDNIKGEFAKDSYVFVVSVSGNKKEFWTSTTNYSLLNALKQLRTENNSTLQGLKVKISRVSDKITETNYAFTKI